MFFYELHCENLVRLLEVKCKSVGSLEILTLRLVHTENPAIFQLQFSFSYFGTGSCGCFGSSSSIPVSCDSLYRPVGYSNFGGQWLALWHQFSDGPKKSYWFSVFSFYFFPWYGKGRDSFYASYMLDWKQGMILFLLQCEQFILFCLSDLCTNNIWQLLSPKQKSHFSLLF